MENTGGSFGEMDLLKKGKFEKKDLDLMGEGTHRGKGNTTALKREL